MAERNNEDRLDLLAEMMDPALEILQDEELRKIINSGEAPLKALKPAIKNHKQAFITILATLEEKDPKEYRVPAPGVFFLKVMALFTRPEIQALFTLQGPKKESKSSGSATENTEESGK